MSAANTINLASRIVLLLFVAAHLNNAQSDCPRQCFCSAPTKIVFCSRKGFSRIPDEIPTDSLQVNLNGNRFDPPILTRANFARFTNLEHLYLSDVGIQSIDADTFADLRNLRWLDLSNNRLKVIQSNTFSGLQLDHLFLNGNPDIQLGPGSFNGLSVTALYLHESSLSSLNPEAFYPLKSSLKNLWLHKNELTSLNEGWKTVFSGLELLRLEQNPFRCDCNLAWFKSFVDSNGNMFRNAPSCESPAKLKWKEIRDLQASAFQCKFQRWLI